MKLTTILSLLLAALVLSACTTPAPPPPMVAPQGEDRFLIDPRTGYAGSMTPAVASRLEAAYRFALAGNEAEAQRRLAEIRGRAPELVPATLLAAMLDIRGGRYDDARQKVAAVLANDPENPAARIYEAEIVTRERRTRAAWDLYRQIAALPGVSALVMERVKELEATLFRDLYSSAQSAPDAEAIRLLREALTFQPGAVEARVLLSRKLLGQRQFEEARRELDPLLDTQADRSDVQEILAEIDAGRGRYQEAILRYDRLARRTRDPRFERRLEEIKNEWSAANMPAHYRAALDSPALTRAELAVLLYWTVPSVRFAQNLGTPQIAVDIEDVAGREEIIRAIALGLFDVDPVTRRVNPYRTISAARLSQALARVLALRGAACSRGATQVLSACGVDDPLAAYEGDATVPGRDAPPYLQQVARQL